MNQSTQFNIQRKSSFVDEVVIHNGKPLFSFIDINPTELCNRTCEFCPRFDPKIYPNKNLHMEIDTVHKIRKELEGLNWNGSINICGNGEPLLHKDIVGLVAALGDKIHVEITTNGDFLKVDLIKDLYKNHLDYMVVSMYDGPEQIEYFTKLFDDSEIDKSRYALRDRWYKEDEEYGLVLTNRAGIFGWNKNMGVGKQCFYMHYSLQIDWNGDIFLCPQDWQRRKAMGNMMQEEIIDIWKGNFITKFRKNLLNGKRCEKPCSDCNADGTLLGKNHAEIWRSIYKI